jgi:integrase
MSVFKRGNVWWYRFRWNSEEIRESTKQSNKRIAEQMEAAHKTSLAKGEVGLREKKKAPTLKQFLEERFLPFVELHNSEKPATVRFYKDSTKVILGFPALASKRLDEIDAEDVSGFLSYLRDFRHTRGAQNTDDLQAYKVSSINRKLSTLRRAFRLASEWSVVEKALPSIKLLSGEARRERVLSGAEEEAYLKAAVGIGDMMIARYEKAKTGIRALERGEIPTAPKDPYLIHHLALILADCGLRPEEAYRLRFEEFREGCLNVAFGKSKNARRAVPASNRVKTILAWRREQFEGDWVFPAETSTGHVTQSTIRLKHKQACDAAEVEYFVPYAFRHTRLTRWAATMDAFTLAYLAGHSDIGTTRRYVHVQMETIRAAVEKSREAETTHNSGHSAEIALDLRGRGLAVIN